MTQISPDHRTRAMVPTKLSRIVPVLLMICAASTLACAGKGPSPRGKSERAKWIESPTNGTSTEEQIKIPDLAVSFEVPGVLYVYRKCSEANHRPDGENKSWIPIIQCFPRGSGGDDDEFASEDNSRRDISPLTFYIAPKEIAINERTVETLRAKYQHQGLIIDEIGYHSSYMSKPNRTGIELRVHTVGDEDVEGRETLRFMFPAGDVLFIAQIEYPVGTDRSGIANDWKRILWNFQLDEDGALYGEDSEEPEAEEAPEAEAE